MVKAQVNMFEKLRQGKKAQDTKQEMATKKYCYCWKLVPSNFKFMVKNCQNFLQNNLYIWLKLAKISITVES